MRYAELHCKSNFSFLEGASHAEELAEQAAALEYAAIAITDRNSLAGIVRAHGAAKDAKVKLIVGAELWLRDAPPIVVWASDRQGYGHLTRLLTLGRRRAEKGSCDLAFEDLAAHHEGLLAGLLPGPSPPDHLLARLRGLRELFGDRTYLLAELHRGPDDEQRLADLQKLARSSRVPLVAAGDIHYHTPARSILHGVLTAIRHGITVDEANRRSELFVNWERHLRPRSDLAALFRRAPSALRRTLEIADRCRFTLDELRYEYPEELAPPGETPLEFLRRLTWEGARRRYPQGVPDKVAELLLHELQLIGELKYEAYFLTVWDLVRYARSRGILCQGRGSAANSAVCFCLEVTAVDPAATDLLFERFVSRERNEAPDIDIDFEHERREEVLQYVYEKYGRDRAAIAAVVITYCSRSAIRDVGKALGLSLDRVDRLAKQAEGYRQEPRLAEHCRSVGIDPDSPLGKRLVYSVNELIGFPRHLSQHVGGMVITRGLLCELALIENAAMEGRTVIEWDKDDLDELGILKVDCLCLGMLTAIRKCFQLIERHYGRSLTLANIPQEDRHVYDMICQADTMGVFQIESRAQMSMLPRLRPRTFYDLVVEVAIVRPGPIQGNMVHPYLRRRAGEPVPPYPNDAIRDILHKTLGVPIFQEQAMRLAVVAAGFTPGEADQLRRAMAAWRRPGIIDQFRIKLLEGMLARGLSQEFAEQVFNQIRGFGEYGFPESHAASFALLVYVSAWLKHYYPAAFTAALINSQPMGFYAPAQLVKCAEQHGVEVRPVDVTSSQWDCDLEEGALRLGFRLIKGASQSWAKEIEKARAERPFASLADLTRRARLSRAVVERLASAGALERLTTDRRTALWQALAQDSQPREAPLLAGLIDDEPTPDLPPLDAEEEVLADYVSLGLSLRAHPISFHRESLSKHGVLPAARLATARNNSRVKVAGIVLVRQRPSTAKGITFVTLEDETGVSNLVIKQPTWQRFYEVARRSPAWIAEGILERRGQVIHVLVHRLVDLSQQIRGLPSQSRDFR